MIGCSCHAYVIFVTISGGTGMLRILDFGVFQYLQLGFMYMLRAPFLCGCGTYQT